MLRRTIWIRWFFSSEYQQQHWAAACDFQPYGISTSVESEEPVQPPFKLRNSKWCSVSSLTVKEYLSDYSKGSDQTERMIWGFAGCTYHIVGNLISQLIYVLARNKKMNYALLSVGLNFFINLRAFVWIYEPVHEISNNVVCATSKASDQPAQSRSLIRAFASRLNILWVLSYCPNSVWSFQA